MFWVCFLSWIFLWVSWNVNFFVVFIVLYRIKEIIVINNEKYWSIYKDWLFYLIIYNFFLKIIFVCVCKCAGGVRYICVWDVCVYVCCKCVYECVWLWGMWGIYECRVCVWGVFMGGCGCVSVCCKYVCECMSVWEYICGERERGGGVCGWVAMIKEFVFCLEDK